MGLNETRLLVIKLKRELRTKNCIVTSNGNTIKLLNKEGKTIYLYNVENKIHQSKPTTNKFEQNHIEIFKNIIKEHK